MGLSTGLRRPNTAAILGLSTILAVVLGACTRPRTQVIVIAETDLAVPDQLDEFGIEITGPDGSTRRATALLREQLPPRHIGLVHEAGPLGPFSVRVRGLRASAPVVERTQSFTFESGRTLALRISLTADCVDVTCGGDETCADGSCRSQETDPEELEPFAGFPDAGLPPGDDAGEPPPQDAAPPTDGGAPPMDAGGCTASDELCNGTDDDCDEAVDEGFDLDNDPSNCGECGNVCTDGACVSGECTPVCMMGTADCDGDPDNGCETDTLSDTDNCGACGERCRGGTRQCCEGVCRAACI